MYELALFAGAGGGILGGHLLGWRCVCAVEIEEYPRRILMQRQDDGILPPFPVWDDIRTFDGRPWAGRVDVISGGFPCQDISAAGKGAGITGERSGLWSEMARVIGEVRPRFVLVENSPLLVSRGLDRVLADLAALGYDARWGIVGAHHAGAPHKRDRIWILATGAGCLADTEGLGWRDGFAKDDGETDRKGDAFGDCSETLADTNNIRRRAGTGRKDGAEAGNRGGTIPNTEEPRSQGPDTAGDSWADGLGCESGPGGRETDWWATEPELG